MTFQESIRGPLSTPLSERQSHLTVAGAAQAEEKLESRLQPLVPHHLGRLQHREAATVQRASPSPIAQSIAEMLQSPKAPGR
jgi:hypothetical protein